MVTAAAEGRRPPATESLNRGWDALLEDLEQQHMLIRLNPVRLVLVMPVAALIMSMPMVVMMASAAEQQDTCDIDAQFQKRDRNCLVELMGTGEMKRETAS
jgi:hypothetical protein